MKQIKRRRSSYLSVPTLPLRTAPVIVWGYDKSEKFVCRLHINAAGIAVFSGEKGGKKLCDVSWESSYRYWVSMPDSMSARQLGP
jgi:hypothetical protein